MDERWLPALGVGALLLVVPLLLCVGMAGDDDEGTPERPPRSRVTSEEDVDLDEADVVQDELVDEQEPQDEVEPEAPTGERELFGVVRNEDGAPVAGAEVMRAGGSRYDETNDEGRYELGSLPAAEMVLTVRAPGYRRAEVTVPNGVNDGRERVDVTLEDGERPGGVVVDPEGRAVRGAEVACEDGEDERIETDAYGRFELSEAALGCPARATSDVHGASAQVTLVAGPNNRLALTTPGSIKGVVVDPEGRPVTTFLVSVASYVDPDGKAGVSRYRQTFSHPQGKFTMSRLAAGRYVLDIARRGAEVRTKAIEVASGGEVATVRVVLE